MVSHYIAVVHETMNGSLYNGSGEFVFPMSSMKSGSSPKAGLGKDPAQELSQGMDNVPQTS